VETSIAVNRFGLGARPGEFEQVAANPRRWLLEQLEGSPPMPRQFDGFPDSIVNQVNYDYRYRQIQPRLTAAQADAEKRGDKAAYERAGADPKKMLDDYVAWQGEYFRMENAARMNVALTTVQPFRERLVRFWSNHLVVPAIKQPSRVLAGAYEREAIRPHVTGRFADMLMASAKNVGMLVFLDNNRSVGPNSPLGRQRRVGLNENLGREILELHTLGVEGGYTQDDVISLSKGITGWSSFSALMGTGGQLAEPDGPFAFKFRAEAHEPGAFTLLGKVYAQQGVAQGEAMLNDLARHPNTARFLARKLAVHFVSDKPSDALVQRLADVYLAHDTDLAEMTRALVESAEPWQSPLAKLKQPEDYVLSVLRALGATVAGDRVPAPVMWDFETFKPRVTLWQSVLGDAAKRAAAVPVAGGEMAGGGMAGEMAAGGMAGGNDGHPLTEINRLIGALTAMGQSPMNAPGPQGWYDTVRDWNGADSLLKRIEWSLATAAQHASGIPNAVDFMAQTLGPLASEGLATAVRRAATREDAIGLVLASPEFQRR
jgi:uncharacterized protein (DUF1800 family)